MTYHFIDWTSGFEINCVHMIFITGHSKAAIINPVKYGGSFHYLTTLMILIMIDFGSFNTIRKVYKTRVNPDFLSQENVNSRGESGSILK